MKNPPLFSAPHVETASGMMLPNDYITAVADAVHAVGGLFVLDCIASGAMGQHGRNGRGCAHQRTPKRLERIAVQWFGDAARRCSGQSQYHNQQQFLL